MQTVAEWRTEQAGWVNRRQDLPIARPATETQQRLWEKLTSGWETGVCVIKRKMETTFLRELHASTEPIRRYQPEKHREHKEPWKGEAASGVGFQFL